MAAFTEPTYLEADRDVIRCGITYADGIPTHGVRVVVHAAPRATHDAESVLPSTESVPNTRLERTEYRLTPCKWNG